MSYDFGIWRRSPATKTAMVLQVWEAITEDRAHPAMGEFDATAVLDALRARFPSPDDDPDTALIAEQGGDGDAAWIVVHAPFSAIERYNRILQETVLPLGLMLWDPQRGAVFGNRRPAT